MMWRSAGEGRKKKWSYYDDDVSQEIGDAYQEFVNMGSPTTFAFQAWGKRYNLDFQNMTQVKEETGYTRQIRWDPD